MNERYKYLGKTRYTYYDTIFLVFGKYLVPYNQIALFRRKEQKQIKRAIFLRRIY